MTEPRPITPFGVSRLRRLTEGQCEQVHEVVARLLMEVGVEIHHDRAKKLLEKAGAKVKGMVVRIPRPMLDWALQTAPDHFLLFDRSGAKEHVVGGDHVLYGCGSETPYILDHRTWERRHGRLSDVSDGVRLIEGLPNFDFLMSLFLPWDLDPSVAYLGQLREMIVNSTKPMVLVAPRANDIRLMIDMLACTSGGEDELKTRPRAAVYINVTNPLRQEFEEIEKVVFLSERGIPFTYLSPVTAGLVGPVVQPGACALAVAGELFGLVLSQVVREGTPIAISGGTTGMFDMKTMVTPYDSPDDRLIFTDMAKFYGKPQFGLGGASDSKTVDGQAAAEAALSLLPEAMGRANLIHDIGYLESGSVNCLSQLVVCDEIIGWIRRLMAPIEINETTLPFDLIKSVGIGGDYISLDHTMEHFRDAWYPKLFDRHKRDKWVANGGRELTAVATEQVEKILKAGKVPGLPQEVLDELDRIIARASRREE